MLNAIEIAIRDICLFSFITIDKIVFQLTTLRKQIAELQQQTQIKSIEASSISGSSKPATVSV